jgi:hypothetical protein
VLTPIEEKSMEKKESASTDQVDEQERLENTSRRTLLKALGYGAIAIVGATGMYPMSAMSAPPGDTKMPMAAAMDLGAKTELMKLNRADLRQLTLTKRLSASTPISQMGLDNKGLELLTPAARELTKGDLEALGAGRVKGKLAKLSVEDVKSIKAAFAGHYNPGLASMDVSCCCCTPCCCAAAVTEPLRKAA